MARADQALAPHLVRQAHHRHRARVANHAAVVAVLDHHQSRGRADQVGATLLANLERADQAHID